MVFLNRREIILRLCLLPKLYLVDLRAVQLLITTQNRREIKLQHSNTAILSQPIQTLTNIIMGKRMKVGSLVKKCLLVKNSTKTVLVKLDRHKNKITKQKKPKRG